MGCFWYRKYLYRNIFLSYIHTRQFFKICWLIIERGRGGKGSESERERKREIHFSTHACTHQLIPAWTWQGIKPATLCTEMTPWGTEPEPHKIISKLSGIICIWTELFRFFFRITAKVITTDSFSYSGKLYIILII